MNQQNMTLSEEDRLSCADTNRGIAFESADLDGIIFDVDGTLWDSTEQAAQVWTRAVREHTGLDTRVSADRLKELFGKTMTEISNALFPTLSNEEQERIMEACYDYENEYLETHPGVLYEGVVETFHALAEKTNLYIVSNCQCGYIELFLEKNQLASYITDFECFGNTGLPKGKNISLLAARNKILASECIYVGDTVGDYEAAKDAGMPFLFAAYGFGAVEGTRQIRDFIELLEK